MKVQLSSRPRLQGSSLGALSLLFATLLLAGCSDRNGATENAAAAAGLANSTNSRAKPPPLDVASRPASSSAAGSADAIESGRGEHEVDGDGAVIELSPLSDAEFEAAKLTGELGCTFSSSSGTPVLVAMGDVASREPAQGIVKVDSKVERLTAPGGFDAMLKGGTFAGAGMAIRVDVTGSAIGGGETPPIPATLTYDRADGAQRTLAGKWICGP